MSPDLGNLNEHRVHVARNYHNYEELKNLEDKYPYLKRDKEFQNQKDDLKEDLEGHGKPAEAEAIKEYRRKNDVLSKEYLQRVKENRMLKKVRDI